LEPSLKAIGAAVGGAAALGGLVWGVVRDLISRISGAHDHARSVAQQLRSEMDERTRETRQEIQRVEADLQNLRQTVATKDDLHTMEHAITEQIQQLRDDQRQRDARIDRVTDRSQ